MKMGEDEGWMILSAWLGGHVWKPVMWIVTESEGGETCWIDDDELNCRNWA